MRLSILLYLEDSAVLPSTVENVKRQMSDSDELYVLSACPFEANQIQEAYALRIKVITGGTVADLCDKAIAQAQGEYIAFINGADFLAPEALTILVNSLQAYPEASFVWAAHTVAADESKFLEQISSVAEQPASIVELLAFGSPKCAVWRASLHHAEVPFGAACPEEPVYAFLMNAARCSQCLFYPTPLTAVFFPKAMPSNAQAAYYNRVQLYESYFKELISGALPIFAPMKSFQTQAQKLSAAIAQLNEGNPPSRQTLESLCLQCILGAWRANDLSLARNLAADILPVLANSECIGLALRRIILSATSPGSVGKKKDGAPLVSVVTPLYNQGEYLPETVQSVLNQNYANWEMIIVNDGSTDDSLSIAQALLREHNDPRIKLISHQNQGKGYTRNRGVREAQGKYICVLDSDDEIAPDYLYVAVQMLESMPQKGWVTPKTLVFGPGHRITWDWVGDTEFAIPRSCSPCSAVYRRSIWEELGGYFEDMTDREDWEFWIRAWEAGWSSTKSTDELLFVYRHAFNRFGTKKEINLKSKLEVINLHPWWFKPLPKKDIIAECLYHDVCNFQAHFINSDYISIANQLHGCKNSFQKYMTWLKAHWHKLYQMERADERVSKLRMGLHYLAKKEKRKASRYLTQFSVGQCEEWQSQLLSSIEFLLEQ